MGVQSALRNFLGWYVSPLFDTALSADHGGLSQWNCQVMKKFHTDCFSLCGSHIWVGTAYIPLILGAMRLHLAKDICRRPLCTHVKTVVWHSKGQSPQIYHIIQWAVLHTVVKERHFTSSDFTYDDACRSTASTRAQRDSVGLLFPHKQSEK